MHIYIIASAQGGPSKIGFAADPKRRLRALQTGNPVPLVLHHAELIGRSAALVERIIHRALKSRRSSGGGEWFELVPDAACIMVRATAAAADALADETASLRDMEMRSVRCWFSELRKYSDKCIEDDKEAFVELDDVRPPSALELWAGTVKSTSSSRFSFKDYLLTWDEGMWLRWAFERMGRRMPSGKRFKPFLEADDFLDRRGAVYGRKVTSRWIEWSAGRDLTPDEAKVLAAIWNKFVPLHNLVERSGPQWATGGIDDHVEIMYTSLP